MATQDISIWDEANTKAVDIITDSSSKNRLMVDAKVSTSPGTYVDNEVTAMIEAGQAFTANSNAVITINANTTLYIQLVTPASPEIHLRDVSLNITKGGASVPTNMYLSEAPTVTTDGTQLTIFNTNRNSTNTATMIVYSGSTVSNTGTRLLAYVTHTDWETYVSPSYTSPFKWILKPSTKYLITIENPSNQSISMTWFVFWLEEDH
jgi:hypothetical protein